MPRTHRRLLGLVAAFIACLAFGAAPLARADAGDGAILRPARISLDQSAELRVPAKDGRAPALPKVDGLSFQRRGESSEMSSVNGVVSQHTWIVYEVVADRPGKFSIPIGTQSLSLEVAPAGAAAPAASTRSGAKLPSTAVAPAASATSEGPLASLRVVIPNRKIFVGQTVPVIFKAYFRAGTEVSLTGAPSLGIPAFTVSDLDKDPRQTVETVGGVPHRVATWTGHATAAMTGRFTTRGELPIIARYRTAPTQPQSRPFGSFFDDDEDPFSASPSSMMRSLMQRMPLGGLDDMFGQVREREMTLRAPAVSVDVQALPAAGRPVDFHGAVGNFTVHTSLTPSSGTAFTPMALSIEVKGQGNLDRVSLTGLAASADWRTYPPSAKTTAAGTKLFEQAVVPQRQGRLELPAISLSYFDPEQKKYVIHASAPLQVEVAAASPGGAPIAAAAAPTSAAPLTSGLRPNRVDHGRFVSTLRPTRRTWFWPVMALPWLALLATVAGSHIRLPASRAHRRALHQSIARHRLAMRSAVAQHDALRFYEAAAAALRIGWGEVWQLGPDQVTAAEAAARSGPDDATMVEILRVAERLRYGGAIVEPASLADLQAQVEHRLERLEG